MVIISNVSNDQPRAGGFPDQDGLLHHFDQGFTTIAGGDLGKQGADGSDHLAILANDLADILGVATKFKHGGLLAIHGGNPNLLGVVNEIADNLLDKGYEQDQDLTKQGFLRNRTPDPPVQGLPSPG